MSDIKKLREEYKKVMGKSPFNGWKEDELKTRMEDATKDLQEQAENPKTVEEVKKKLKTEEDILPPVPEKEKTDKEVIDELNKDSKVPEPKTVTPPAPDVPPEEPAKAPTIKFTKEVGLIILDKLYKALTDGKYRRYIIDIKEKEIKKQKDFVRELQILMNSVYEGELKAVVLSYINQLT